MNANISLFLLVKVLESSYRHIINYVITGIYIINIYQSILYENNTIEYIYKKK